MATLRAEFYDAFLKSPLAGLLTPEAEGAAAMGTGARLDRSFNLLPPGLAEMAEVVRAPACAAGLDWEVDAATGERLDERLIKDIDRPDLLPLLQFVLDRLYEQREGEGENMRLTFAAYRALGTLDGAIDTAAEAALAGLGPAERDALPRLLRTLIVYAPAGAGSATPTLRQAPRPGVAWNEAAVRLVDAMIAARILTSAQDERRAPVVSLAHQRVADAWGRAKQIIAESAGVLRIRGEVEAARRRWEDNRRRRDLLLPAGLPLSEAEKAVATLSDELAAETRAYVRASSRAPGCVSNSSRPPRWCFSPSRQLQAGSGGLRVIRLAWRSARPPRRRRNETGPSTRWRSRPRRPMG